MADQQGVHGLKTTLGIADTLSGSYSAIGHLVGEIPLPASEREINEFADNDGADPIQHAGPKKVGEVDLVIAYQTHAAYVALAAKDDGASHFLKFTLENGDFYTYRGMVSKVSPVASFEEGFAMMGFSFKPAVLAAHGMVT